MEKDTSIKKWEVCIIYSPSILTFSSPLRSLNTVSMVGKRECELPERRSKQQNGLKNFETPFLIDNII